MANYAAVPDRPHPSMLPATVITEVAARQPSPMVRSTQRALLVHADYLPGRRAPGQSATSSFIDDAVLQEALELSPADERAAVAVPLEPLDFAIAHPAEEGALPDLVDPDCIVG